MNTLHFILFHSGSIGLTLIGQHIAAHPDWTVIIVLAVAAIVFLITAGHYESAQINDDVRDVR